MHKLQLFFENIGLAYEQLVTKIIRKATGKLKNIAVLKSSGGAFDAHSADLSIRIKKMILQLMLLWKTHYIKRDQK